MFFFFNDTATTEIYTLSLHDALPICRRGSRSPAFGARTAEPTEVPICPTDRERPQFALPRRAPLVKPIDHRDRKSTRLNSSHANISYAVFCLKKKKNYTTPHN